MCAFNGYCKASFSRCMCIWNRSVTPLSWPIKWGSDVWSPMTWQWKTYLQITTPLEPSYCRIRLPEGKWNGRRIEVLRNSGGSPFLPQSHILCQTYWWKSRTLLCMSWEARDKKQTGFGRCSILYIPRKVSLVTKTAIWITSNCLLIYSKLNWKIDQYVQ